MPEKSNQLATINSPSELARCIPDELAEEFRNRMEKVRKEGIPEPELFAQVMHRWLGIEPDKLLDTYKRAEGSFPGGFAGLLVNLKSAGNPGQLFMARACGILPSERDGATESLEKFLAYHLGDSSLDLFLQNGNFCPDFNELIKTDPENAKAYAEKAFYSSFIGPHSEFIQGIFRYQLESYGAADFDETLKTGHEIVQRYGETPVGMNGFSALPNLDEILNIYMSPDHHEFNHSWKSCPEYDVPAFRKELLKNLFGRKAQPHLMAWTFSELVTAGLKPELVTRLFEGPLGAYLDECYELEATAFSALMMSSEGAYIVRFEKVREITPEFEEALMLVAQANELEYLLRVDGKVRRIQLLEDDFEEKVDHQYDLAELTVKARDLVSKLKSFQNNPIYAEHFDFSSPIEDVERSLSLTIFRQKFEQSLKVDERPIKRSGRVHEAARFHELENYPPEFKTAIAALGEAENLEFILSNYYAGNARATDVVRGANLDNVLRLAESKGILVPMGETEKKLITESDMAKLMLRAAELLKELVVYAAPANPLGDLIDWQIFAEMAKTLQATCEAVITHHRFRILLKTKTPSSFLAETNETTQLIITGTALLMALGAADKEMAGTLRALPEPGNHNVEQLLELATKGSDEAYWKELMRRTQEAQPEVEKLILQQRSATPGIMPIGGKIHVENPVPFEALSKFQSILQLNSTPFRMIHAGKSLLLPPLPSAAEQCLLLHFLEKMNIVDGRSPQIQTAMAGRWSNEIAGMVGSAMLLGTRKGNRYKKGAFSTTHDEATGARIMSYDAGIKLEGLPFDLSTAKGRTDMLGRHSYSDFDLYQVLGTLASHLEFGGIFERDAEQFRGAYTKLLEKYDLKEAVSSSAWIYNQELEGDDLEKHEEMVSRITDQWFEGLGRGVRQRFGIIGEVRGLVLKTSQSMRARSKKVIASKAEDYQRLMKY